MSKMMSDKELARWREQYKNAGRPCLCAELLDHIDAQAEQLKKATKERNIFRDSLVDTEAGLAKAEELNANWEAILIEELAASQDIDEVLGVDQSRVEDGVTLQREHLRCAKALVAERDALAERIAALEKGHKEDRATINAYFSASPTNDILERFAKHPIASQLMNTAGAAYDFNELCKRALLLEAERAALDREGE